MFIEPPIVAGSVETDARCIDQYRRFACQTGQCGRQGSCSVKTAVHEHSLARSCPSGTSDGRSSQIDDCVTAAERLFPITGMLGVPANAFTEVSEYGLRTGQISGEYDDLMTSDD